MNITKYLFHTHTTPNEDQADRLATSFKSWYTVEVQPPQEQSLPATLDGFVRSIREFQSTLFSLRNASPTVSFEVRRSISNQVQFQFSVPTKRLERKIRTHLTNELPSASFDPGTNGLPVTSEESVGGGILTVGRRDWYPLQTEFDSPPHNSLTATLHRHAMRDTKIVVQVLFQPVIGQPVRQWWWRKRAYQRIGHLRREKEKLWGSRSATPREKQQAKAIEDKVATSRFWTSIRFVVVGAGEYTPSRIKELSGAFNTFENPDNGQYLNTITVKTLREQRILHFCKAVADRGFNAWSQRFQASIPELAALVSIPDRHQENIEYSKP